VRTGRTAALFTLLLGGIAALAAWSALIWDLLVWQAPRIAVVPPIAGSVLPRVEVVRWHAEADHRGNAFASKGEAPADAAPDAPRTEDPPAAAGLPAAEAQLASLMDALKARLDAQREPVRARTTGTAPPRIPLPRDVVTCGGIRARGVDRVAYLIDCSARSEPHISMMVDEVMRSIARLDDAQSFAVIACRKDWAQVAPPGAMRKGGASFGSSVEADLRTWLRERATPSDAPQIYAGIEAAMATRPDIVVLVSAGLATPGDGDDVRDAALGAFERANPRDARTGKRAARVMALVAGGQDPKGVLATIAAAHATDAALHGVLAVPVPARAPAEVASIEIAPQAESDERLIEAMRRALADPSDPASARALLEATVIAQSTGWPREHVARMASATARRAEALGLDEIAAEAGEIARRAAEGSPR
jgi:hypothetical protein